MNSDKERTDKEIGPDESHAHAPALPEESPAHEEEQVPGADPRGDGGAVFAEVDREGAGGAEAREGPGRDSERGQGTEIRPESGRGPGSLPTGELFAADGDRGKAIVEALLFVSEQPLSLEKMAGILGLSGRKEIRSLLQALNEEYRAAGRAFEIVEVAQGYQVRTRAEFSRWIAKLKQQRFQRLSKPALESLAIIAYRQPLTRAEIESIRGVDTGAVLGSLLERKLIRILGRKEVPGRPILYGTSPEFLELFGLKSLSSLPTLREIEDMFKEVEVSETGGGGVVDGDQRAGQASTAGPGGEGLPLEGKDAAIAAVADPGSEGLEPRGAGAKGQGEGVLDGAEEAAGRGREEDAEVAEGDWDTSEMDLILRSTRIKILPYEGDQLGKGPDDVWRKASNQEPEPEHSGEACGPEDGKSAGPAEEEPGNPGGEGQ